MTPEAKQLEDRRAYWGAHRCFRPSIWAVPPIAENTRVVPAGPVELWVESRLFSEEIRAAHMANMAAQGVTPTQTLDNDEGPSVHVIGSADQHEYLRFDLFRDQPHYHYLVPGLDGVVTILFDREAHGEMIPWLSGALRSRLGSMLESAGAPRLAEQLDPVALGRAVDEVDALLR